MRKLSCIVMSLIIAAAATSCSSKAPQEDLAMIESSAVSVQTEDTVVSSEADVQSEAELSAVAKETDPKFKQALDECIEDYEFEGIIYAEKGGDPIAVYSSGKLENGDDITIDTPMPIGSVSKQFCAAAVMLLAEEGKLTIDDTLDKYFPDYPEGGRLTIKDLLSMRSGIPEVTEDSELVTIDKTEEENRNSIKELTFEQQLMFEPGTKFQYANINYFLLSDIVEQVTGMKYGDYLRSSFFTPLGMMHTGMIGELDGSPEWADGVDFDQIDKQPGLTNGCGDIISNALDISTWIKALSAGEVISQESYKAMTTSYSEEGYGFGMYTNISGGVGHYGAIGIYSAFDYINEDTSFTLVTFSNTIYPLEMTPFSNDIINVLNSGE